MVQVFIRAFRHSYLAALFLITLGASAQSYTNNPGYFSADSYWGKRNIRPGIRDTSAIAGKVDSIGSVIYWPATKSLWNKTDTGWAKVGSGFNIDDYVPVTRSINTTSPLSGGGNLSADRTLSIANAQADGENKGAATFRSDHFDDDGLGAISLQTDGGNPAWITALSWNKITGTPTTLSGYGITDGVANTRAVNTTSPLQGGGNLSADRTLSIANAAADGATKGASTYNASHFNDNGAGTISLDVPNGPFVAKADSAAMLSHYINLAENGLYKSGQTVRLGTNQLIENTNIPLNGNYLSITGNGTPLGTFANPSYDFRHIHNQAGPVGISLSNNNRSGAVAIAMSGDSAGVSGSLSLIGRDIIADSLNAYARAGTIQLAAGSSINELYLRALKKFAKIRFGIDSTTVAVIDSSSVVPGAKSIRIKPRSYPEADLEIVNNGNTIIPDSPLHRIPVGIIRTNWAGIFSHGITLDNAAGKWLTWDIIRSACAMEVGYEGVSLHASARYRHFSDQLHECLQARGWGLDGGATGAGTDTGKFVQIKVPLAFRYTSTPYSSDIASWEGGDNRPFIWMISEESKVPEGEFVRLEQNAATTTGGQIYFKKSRGTANSKAAGSSGDMAGILNFSNYDGANYVTGARIMSVLESNASAGSSPTALRFDAGSSSGTLAERMRVTSGGNLLINTTSTNGSRLQVNGNVSTAITTVTGNTTLDATHSTVLVNNTGSVTITLPAASGKSGWIYTIKKVSAASNDVIIDPNASELLDGSSTSKTLTLQWSSITIQCNGTSWFVISSHAAATTL